MNFRNVTLFSQASRLWNIGYSRFLPVHGQFEKIGRNTCKSRQERMEKNTTAQKTELVKHPDKTRQHSKTHNAVL